MSMKEMACGNGFLEKLSALTPKRHFQFTR